MRKSIYIIRHGETDMNKNGYIQGSGVDSSLNEKGQWQAQAFYNHYKHLNFEVVLTSKLVRTHQTVAPFVQNGLSWEQFPEINEMSWGVYEGKRGDEMMRKDYKSMINEWKQGNFDHRLPQAESAAELANRIQKFVDQLRTRTEELILVCSHGRAMRCLMCVLNGDHLGEMERYKHANTGLYKAIYENDQFTLELENDIQHIKQAELNSII